MGQMHIFVSHSSEDNAFTSDLVQALRIAGADVWFDQDNLGAGVLRQHIMRELIDRPVFLVMLSHAAFASRWVQDECEWAYNLYRREPNRLILPVTASAYEPTDFNSMLYLESLKRIERAERQPYPQADAIQRTLDLLELTLQGATPMDATTQATQTTQQNGMAAELIRHGKIVSAQGHDELALAFYQCAAHVAPTREDAWFLLGYALNQVGRWEAALHALHHARNINPDNAYIWGNIGYALNRLERFEEGLASSERAVTLEPLFSTGWNNQGWALHHLQRFSEALIAYDRALSLSPTDSVYQDNRAMTLRAMKLRGMETSADGSESER